MPGSVWCDWWSVYGLAEGVQPSRQLPQVCPELGVSASVLLPEIVKPLTTVVINGNPLVDLVPGVINKDGQILLLLAAVDVLGAR